MRCGCFNCNGDQCSTCFECKPQHQAAHDMLMLIALGVDKLGEGLSMDGVATVIDNNRELIPTLYPKLVELMKLLTSMTGNEEWNALAPWRRERR